MNLNEKGYLERIAVGLEDYARSKTMVIEELNITEDGTYEAEEGKAFNPVKVNTEPDYRVITINNESTKSITMPSSFVEDGWLVQRNVSIASGKSADVKLPIPTNALHSTMQVQPIILLVPSYFKDNAFAFPGEYLTYRGYATRNSNLIMLVFDIGSNAPKNFSFRFYEPAEPAEELA